MNKACLIITAAIFLLFLGACDLIRESEMGHGEIDQINFEPGTVYTYSRILMRTDSTQTDTLEVIASDTLQVSVHREYNIIELANTLRFETTDVQSGQLTETWYLNNNDNFLELASRNAGRNPPVQPKTVNSIGTIFEATGPVPSLITEFIEAEQEATADTLNPIIFRDQPRIVYDYPMHAGKRWISFIEPFTVSREVVGVETIEAAGRDQFLARIKNDFELYSDLGGEVTIEELVGETGLYSRVISSSQSGFQPQLGKDPFPGTFYLMDVTELISVQVPN